MRTGRILAGLLISITAIAAFPLKSEAKLSSKDLYKQFQNPDSRYRPFVRWWWNGDRVEAEELVRELHLLIPNLSSGLATSGSICSR